MTSKANWSSIMEGLLFVVGDEGIDAKQLAEILEIDKKEVAHHLEVLQQQYRQQGRGLQIVEVAGAYQFTTLPEHAPYFQRLAYSPSHTTLSQAALETLAIVAYKQPLTRIDVEEIRGVRCEKPIQTLVAKGLIQEVGRAEVVGRPILYGTTKDFLDYFGLRSLNDLPPAPAFLSPEDIEEEAKTWFDKLDNQLSFDDLDRTEQK
jgi:segregation and condensation protein B